MNSWSVIVCIVLQACLLHFGHAADSKGFYLNIRSIEDCIPSSEKDPDHPTVNVSLGVIKRSKTEEEIGGNVTYFNDVHLEKFLIEAKPEGDMGDSKVHRREIDKPCDHFLFSIFLKKTYNMDKNCVVKKGTYKLEPINPNLIMHALYKEVHHSAYTAMFEWFSDKGALACLKLTLNVVPF